MKEKSQCSFHWDLWWSDWKGKLDWIEFELYQGK